MITDADVAEFYDRFEALNRHRPDSPKGIQAEELTTLVRAFDPEVAALVTRGFVEFARKETRSTPYWQRAIVLAAAYQVAHDDDTLTQFVEGAMRDAKVADVSPGFFVPPDVAKAQASKFVNISVDPQQLKRGDVYPLIRLFSFDARPASEWSELARMRGRLSITFDLPDDGVGVWDRDDVRQFMTNLIRGLPYLPYFLNNDPRLGMPQVLLLSLAEPSARQPTGIDLTDDSVVATAFALVLGVRAACEKTGEPFEATARERLPYFPAEFLNQILEALHETT